MALLEFAHAKGMEDFLDPVLTVCRYFLIRNAGKHKGTTNGNLIAASNGLKGGHSFDQNMLIEDIADFARNAGLFLELCGSHEPRLAESASECLVLAVKAAPKVAAESILSNISELTKALETSSLIHNPALLSLLQRRLLQVLTVACREQRMALVNSQLLPAPVLQTSTIVPLENIIHKLRKSSLPHVADAAIDAATSTRKDLNEYSNKTLCPNKADFLEIVAGSTTKDEETKCNRKAVRRHLCACALQLAASQSQ